jgi:DNA-binding NtrC family response regulator
VEKTVLVIDDDDLCREAVQRHLTGHYALCFSESLAAARGAMEQAIPDCALLDFRLPDGDGLALLPHLVARRIPVVMCTSQGNEEIAVRALQEGADDYIVKNTMNRPMLRRSIANAIERARLRAELVLREQEKDTLIEQLQTALRDIETLRGLLSICARCKKIRNADGGWQSVESYVSTHSQARFTHGFCPECFEREVEAIREGL